MPNFFWCLFSHKTFQLGNLNVFPIKCLFYPNLGYGKLLLDYLIINLLKEEAMDQFKKIMLASLGIFFISMLTPMATNANSGSTYEVNSDMVNVREEPASAGQIIGMLSKGDRLVVFQEKYGWVQTYYAGKIAWVASHHLVPVDSSASEATHEASDGTISVTVSSAHVRSGPGLEYEPIHSAVKGDTYQLAGTEGEWEKIMLPNGSYGWVASHLTDQAGADAEVDSEASTENASTGSNENSAERAPAQSSSSGSLQGYNIVIDPGHGGKDPGAIGLGGIYEKDLAISTAEKVEQKLTDAGATVIMSRSGDYFVPLEQRSSISNSHDTHAFISIHYDSYPVMSVRGISTYYADGKDYGLAQSVQASLANSVNMNNRGIMQGNYIVLRDTSAPAVLMELGFVSNPEDLAAITTADYQNQAAEAIKQGLIDYFH